MNTYISERDKQKYLDYLDSFASAVALYQEKLSTSGTISAQDYAKGAESGKATNTGSSQTITPSISDFICDIELAARRCLAPGDYAYWLMYYKSGLTPVTTPEDIKAHPDNLDETLEWHIKSFPEHQWDAVWSIDQRMRSTLGKHLLDIGVSPVSGEGSAYFKSVDVRFLRAAKHKWSHLY